MIESAQNINDSLGRDAYELINSLSIEKKQEAINFLKYLKDKDEWEATLELNSPEILNEIKIGISELLQGEYVDFKEIKRNV